MKLGQLRINQELLEEVNKAAKSNYETTTAWIRRQVENNKISPRDFLVANEKFLNIDNEKARINVRFPKESLDKISSIQKMMSKDYGLIITNGHIVSVLLLKTLESNSYEKRKGS